LIELHPQWSHLSLPSLPPLLVLHQLPELHQDLEIPLLGLLLLQPLLKEPVGFLISKISNLSTLWWIHQSTSLLLLVGSTLMDRLLLLLPLLINKGYRKRPGEELRRNKG